MQSRRFFWSAICLVPVIAGLTQVAGICEDGVPPPEWVLMQNTPNPFCGDTTIEFGVEADAEVLLEVWNPDASSVVRTLFDGYAQIGQYQILWDGLPDGGGSPLPCGDYPYTLIATDVGTGTVLFQDEKVATIHCDASPAKDEAWGNLKTRFRSHR